jgi:ribonuclease HII
MPKKANKTKESNDYVSCEIIESEEISEPVISAEPEIPIKKPRVKQQLLSTYYLEDPKIIEIGVDEVGRGPLFGRVYTAAVILPKDVAFDHSKMKDSKKFSSKKKIIEAAQYIKDNAIAWNITYEDEKFIDEHNILVATQKSMHKSIEGLISKYELNKSDKFQLLIDGNYFKPYTYFNKTKKMIEQLDNVCIEGGDNKYSAIAAASILAKVERDAYIDELCEQYPELVEKYNINCNKGYGAKKHLDGIKEHGITIWHRRSFGICKNYNI